MEEPLIEPLLEPESENYEEPPQVSEAELGQTDYKMGMRNSGE